MVRKLKGSDVKVCENCSKGCREYLDIILTERFRLPPSCSKLHKGKRWVNITFTTKKLVCLDCRDKTGEAYLGELLDGAEMVRTSDEEEEAKNEKTKSQGQHTQQGRAEAVRRGG